MSNPNDHKSYGREVRQESYNDANGHTHVTRSTETVNNDPQAYSDGYVHGQVSERNYQEDYLVQRDNENASRGLLIGILLATLAALTAGAFWFFNQRENDGVVPVAPVVVPDRPAVSPSPEANQQPQRETTIIEREVPVVVPVPQQQTSTAPQPSASSPAPDINIDVRTPVQQPPATQREQNTTTDTQSNSSTTTTSPTQDTQSDTSTSTSAEDTSSQTGTTSGSSTTSGNTTGESAQ